MLCFSFVWFMIVNGAYQLPVFGRDGAEEGVGSVSLEAFRKGKIGLFDRWLFLIVQLVASYFYIGWLLLRNTF